MVGLLLCVAQYKLLFHSVTEPVGPMATSNSHGGKREDIAGLPASSWLREPGKPKLDLLLKKISSALSPFMITKLNTFTKCNHTYSQARINKFSPGCKGQCVHFPTLKAAKDGCSKSVKCHAITRIADRIYELRSSAKLEDSPSHETSWVRLPCQNRTQKGDTEAIWETFSRTMDRALENESLGLTADPDPTRSDGSIFLAVASYRDPECPYTVKNAFLQADNPQSLNVGVVQMNCYAGCFTGAYKTKESFTKTGPDKDCVQEFCSSKLGAHHCREQRVRILRLDESEAYGPMFARYLLTKMYRGEEFYIQIDSHIQFRKGWDTTTAEMMRKTLTYPHSALSNYPPGFAGHLSGIKSWPRYSGAKEPAPNALCGVDFEKYADQERWSMKLKRNARNKIIESPYEFKIGVPIPRHACFAAGGFFAVHGSFIHAAPVDPFLPYVFWGEEMYISMLLWTSGYDIYAPSVDVVRHHYDREGAPHFWDFMDFLYEDNLHNSVIGFVLGRLQHAMHFPGYEDPDRVKPQSLLVRMDKYKLGSKRSVEDFFKFVGMNLTSWHTPKKSQISPLWCKDGSLPPFFKGFSESFVRARCGTRHGSYLRHYRQTGRAISKLPC